MLNISPSTVHALMITGFCFALAIILLASIVYRNSPAFRKRPAMPPFLDRYNEVIEAFHRCSTELEVMDVERLALQRFTRQEILSGKYADEIEALNHLFRRYSPPGITGRKSKPMDLIDECLSEHMSIDFIHRMEMISFYKNGPQC